MRSRSRGPPLLRGAPSARGGALPRLHSIVVGSRESDSRAVGPAHLEDCGPNSQSWPDGERYRGALMAGELCGRGCGWCGRCDAEPDFETCDDCGRTDCLGDCQEFREFRDAYADEDGPNGEEAA